MAKMKRKPRFPTKFIADCYHYLVEEENDKLNYKLGTNTFQHVWLTYYDCYCIVHCQYTDKELVKVTFAKKTNDFVYVKSKWYNE